MQDARSRGPGGGGPPRPPRQRSTSAAGQRLPNQRSRGSGGSNEGPLRRTSGSGNRVGPGNIYHRGSETGSEMSQAKRRRDSSTLPDSEKVDPVTLALMDEVMRKTRDKKWSGSLSRLDKERQGRGTFLTKKETIKRMPVSLTRKRKLKKAFTGLEKKKKRRKKENIGARMKIFCQFKLHFVYWALIDLWENIWIWQTLIYKISAEYGIGVGYYFRWLRTFLGLNILFLIFSVSCTTLRQTSTSPIKSKDKWTSDEVFTARGFLKGSYLFMANYNRTDEEDRAKALKNMGFLFIFVVIIVFIINSIFLFKQFNSYYDNLYWDIDCDQVRFKQYCIRIINFWKFRINDSTKAKIAQKLIDTEILKMYKDVYRDIIGDPDQFKARGIFEQCCRFFCRGFARIAQCIFSTLFLIGLSVLAAYILGLIMEWKHNKKGNSFGIVALPLYMSLTSTFYAVLTNYSIESESWKSAKTRTYHLLLRLTIIYFCYLIRIYKFWHVRSSNNLNLDLNKSAIQGEESSTIKDSLENSCWESDFGIEIYQIIVLEGLIKYATNFLRYVIWGSIKRALFHGRKLLFDSDAMVAHIFFINALATFGIFFVPLLPLVLIIRIILTFYGYLFIVNYFCRPTQYLLHVSQYFMPFIVVYLIYFVLVLYLNAIVITEAKPSTDCGPYEKNHSTFSDVFKDIMDEKRAALFFNSGVFLILLIVLLGFLYLSYSWANGYRKAGLVFQNIIALERKDREYLLEEIYKQVILIRPEMKMKEDKDDKDEYDKLMDSIEKRRPSAAERLRIAGDKLEKGTFKARAEKIKYEYTHFHDKKGWWKLRNVEEEEELQRHKRQEYEKLFRKILNEGPPVKAGAKGRRSRRRSSLKGVPGERKKSVTGSSRKSSLPKDKATEVKTKDNTKKATEVNTNKNTTKKVTATETKPTDNARKASAPKDNTTKRGSIPPQRPRAKSAPPNTNLTGKPPANKTPPNSTKAPANKTPPNSTKAPPKGK